MLWLRIMSDQCTLQILGNPRVKQLLWIQIPYTAKGVSASLFECVFCCIDSHLCHYFFYLPSWYVFHFILTCSVCLCVFSENCFCLTQFLMETDPQRIYTRVVYNLLHLLIYCFHLPSTSLWSFVVFSCSVRNFTPSAPIDTFLKSIKLCAFLSPCSHD